MAEQWRVIDLCGFEGELRSTRGGVEVWPEEGASTTIPVAEVAVVLVGMKVALSAAVLHR
ncbi:MAG: type II CRISPR-associated endonuclease Cas1, partial [Trueperella pyogenes]|nr:type II CRISPR-associated endonuclease Cas1 [Trueperella pyogenes]